MLVLDATARQSAVEPLSAAVVARTLGGKGLGVHLLTEFLRPGTDALAPEAPIIFVPGPAAGSRIWGSCRYGAYAKSPLTGLWGESYSGGTLAERMAETGFDAFVIIGQASGPVWIEITEQGGVFHDASEIWGKDTAETETSLVDRLTKEHGAKAGALTIGPAGENLVRFAVLENDLWRSAGRGGMGAALGFKRVKAVAFWGNRHKPAGDEKTSGEFVKELAVRSKTDAGVAAYKKLGTPMLVDTMNGCGGFPARCWTKGRSGHQAAINAAALLSRCEVKANACAKCFMACGKLSTVKAGPYAGLTVEGPEYETIYAFGGLCEISAIEDILYLNDICDRLGLDTISAGNLAALAIEAGRQGIIPKEADYGDTEAVARLLRKMTYGEGVGRDMAQGIRHVARIWRMEDQAVHVKGMEPAGYDPRRLKGMGLAYATSDRGACHLRATFYKPELSGLVDPAATAGKAAVFVEWEDRLTFFDMLIVCRFYRDMYQWPELARITKALTGRDYSIAELQILARETKDAVRRFNLREGWTPKDDALPYKLLHNALPEHGNRITDEDMEVMLREYYQARGWDAEGTPPPA